MNFHPAASLFPLMDGDEFEALVQDIAAHGQIEPILLCEGMVLDGRNRWRACERLGVKPKTKAWQNGDSPVAFVVSANLRRRHLTAGQKATIAVDMLPMLEEEARKRMLAGVTPNPSAQLREGSGKAAEQAAASAGVGARYVETAKKVKQAAPDLFEQVKTGEVTLATAIREVKRAEVVARLKDVAVQEVKAAAGVYDVIVIDPPWPMQKIEREVRPNQTLMDYPTMTEAELMMLKLPVAQDCHVWLWTTQRFLPFAFELLGEWGLSYVCTFVWHKPGGFQPVGLPQYNCEFALYARKGKPKFIDTKALSTCFEAGRGAHSEKPQAFYDMVARVTAGRRLDMFNRRVIPGFDGWGQEAHD